MDDESFSSCKEGNNGDLLVKTHVEYLPFKVA